MNGLNTLIRSGDALGGIFFYSIVRWSGLQRLSCTYTGAYDALCLHTTVLAEADYPVARAVALPLREASRSWRHKFHLWWSYRAGVQ